MTFLLDYRYVPDICISQCRAATHLRCDGFFNDHFITWEKFWTRVGYPVLWLTGCKQYFREFQTIMCGK